MQSIREFGRKSCVLVFVFIAWHAGAQEATTASDGQKAVLITGASSGIGLKTTQVLSSAGTFVYAGARKQADIDRLNAMDNVEAVRLDVTKWHEINAAVEQIRSRGRGLDGVVNNAGVALLGPLVEVPESDLDVTFNVNVFGPYRITKAFVPLLLESKGRVVNIGSVSGIQANMLFGTYSMSKAAMEAYNDVLATELAPFGVRVIGVTPGAYNSRLAATGVAAMKARGIKADDSIYTMIPWDDIEQGMSNGAGAFDWPEPDDVALAIQDALFSESAKDHYMVTSSERVAEVTIRKLIEELVRYNEEHAYSYNRDELVAMLDEELSGERDASSLSRFDAPPTEER